MTKEQMKELVEAACVEELVQAILEQANDTLQPEDVFSDTKLAEWAEANGYEEAD